MSLNANITGRAYGLLNNDLPRLIKWANEHSPGGQTEKIMVRAELTINELLNELDRLDQELWEAVASRLYKIVKTDNGYAVYTSADPFGLLVKDGLELEEAERLVRACEQDASFFVETY
jgi:hypothetical protein